MGEFIILTDNTVDLPASWMEEREVDCEYLPCTVDGIVYDKKNKIECSNHIGNHCSDGGASDL